MFLQLLSNNSALDKLCSLLLCFVAPLYRRASLTEGLAYANVLAPLQHLHHPQKTLLSLILELSSYVTF